MEEDKPIEATANQDMFNDLQKNATLPAKAKEDGVKWVDIKGKSARELDQLKLESQTVTGMIIYDSTGLGDREVDQLKNTLFTQYLRHESAGLKPHELDEAKEKSEEEERRRQKEKIAYQSRMYADHAGGRYNPFEVQATPQQEMFENPVIGRREQEATGLEAPADGKQDVTGASGTSQYFQDQL